MSQDYHKLDTIFESNSVVPVLAVKSQQDALAVATTLKAGGINVIEILLRTKAAIDCIATLKEMTSMLVGAGTILNPSQFEAAVAAGADFLVAPGTTKELIRCAEQHTNPLIPGASTVSEIMALVKQGYYRLKFFPAHYIGGVNFLKSMSAPFPNAMFYVTGGLTSVLAQDYLALDNVIGVGGSWITPPNAIIKKDWQLIEQLAKQAKEQSDRIR